MKRTHFTWFNYVLLAFYAFLQASIGLFMPFLRDELSLSFSVAGLHMSAFATGMIAAGVFSGRVLAVWPPRRVFWLGGGGMLFGLAVLVLGQHPLMTIAGAGLMGGLGSVILIAVQVYLVKTQPQFRTTALAEANVIASVGATSAPLLIGGLASTVFGWRATLGVMAVVLLVMMLGFRGRPDLRPETEAAEAGDSTGRLPSQFWVFWLVLFAVIAIEWCIVFWGASYLEEVVGVSKANASLAMSAFFGAVIISRIIGSRLSLRADSTSLLLVALGLVGLGFPLFWLVDSAVVSVVGLFISGLGVANLYPMTIASTMNAAPGLDDAASAKATMAVGLSMLSMPQLLGMAADWVGITVAFGGVLFWLALSVVLTLIARRWQQPAKVMRVKN